MEQEALYATFVDLKKAYNVMDRERCLQQLEGYGGGPNMRRLIDHFWDVATLACRAVGVYGASFKAYRGVTQGGLLLLCIFNVMVDAIVREWLRQVLGTEAAMYGYKDEFRILMAIIR